MPSETTPVNWEQVRDAAESVALRWKRRNIDSVYGVPAGGTAPALIVAQRLGLPIIDTPRATTLIVDDLVDSGATASRYNGHIFDACFRKPTSPPHIAPHAKELTGWLTFPWEQHNGEPTDAVTRLLQHIGEDPTREGLRDTPRRVVKALTEMTAGYNQTPDEILTTTFSADCDEMIVVSAIPFVSLCEHHLLPFTGTATIGYIPIGSVVGLSKLPRLVHAYAHRLQIQEQLTRQIGEAIDTHLKPLGTGVVLTAHHTCMSHRGIRSHGNMTTSYLSGAMRDNPAARAEFLAYNTP